MTLAEPADAAAIVALRDELARWQISRGIRQWEAGEIRTEMVAGQVRNDEWFVLRGTFGIVATARLLTADPHVWGDELGNDGTAGYLHGLMVARSAAGAGLGTQILEWFADYTRSVDRHLARLDCVADNPRLRQYYTEQGYIEHGLTDHGPASGWKPVVRFQKKLS